MHPDEQDRVALPTAVLAVIKRHHGPIKTVLIAEQRVAVAS